jgi:hypothetical protein
MPTFDEVRGPVERGVYIGVMWLAGKGYIGDSDTANYIAMIVATVAVIYGYFQNRRQGILKSAARVPNTVVVTSQEMSDATPKNINILSVNDSQESVTNAVKRAKTE